MAEKGKPFGWVFGDAKNKLVALIFAVIIWAVVHSALTEPREWIAHVYVMPRVGGKPAADRIGATASPDEVRVILRGAGAVLDKMEPMYRIEFRPVVDDPRIGTELEITLSERDIEDLPSGVRVAGITPSKVKVSFTRKMTKKMRVKPNIQSAPAEGFVLQGAPLITPSEVDITGPENLMKAHSTIDTEPIELAGRREPFSADYDIWLLLGNVDVVCEGRRQVQIDFNIVEQNVTWVQKLPVQVITPNDYPFRVKIDDMPGVVEKGMVSVSLHGPRKLKEDPRLVEEIRAFVTLSSADKPDPSTAKPRLVDLYVPPAYKELLMKSRPMIFIKIFEPDKPGNE